MPLLPEENCLKIVVGAKLDLVTDDNLRAVTRQEGRQFAAQINDEFLSKHDDVMIPFFETSSKTGEGVSEVFEYIFGRCLSPLSTEYRRKSDRGTIDLRKDKPSSPTNANDKQQKEKVSKKCC